MQNGGILVKPRQILKEKGPAKDADVKGICERPGLSPKTRYQSAKSLEILRDKAKVSEEELAQLKSEQEALEERAWEIHLIFEIEGERRPRLPLR